MIEDSERLKSSSETHAITLADHLVPFTPTGHRGLVYLRTDPHTTSAISILMVDFSCALKLSMPLAVFFCYA